MNTPKSKQNKEKPSKKRQRKREGQSAELSGYKKIVDEIPALICRFLPDGTLTFVNKSYCTYFNKKRSELIGYNFYNFLPVNEHQKTRKMLEALTPTHPSITYTHTVQVAENTLRWQEWIDTALFDRHGKPTEYVSIGYDITEKIENEKHQQHWQNELIRIQKLEALGTMVGGIAHDFNNLLGIILNNMELITLDLDKSNPTIRHLEKIERATLRAKNTIQQLLSIVKKQEAHSEPVLIIPLLEDTVALMRAATSHPISLKIDKSLHQPIVVGNSAQLQQVIINLITNANQAITSTTGKIKISLTEIETPSSLNPQTYPKAVKIAIRDNGCGIPASMMNRIFDPYFTTKNPDEGTGLGLPVVQGILRNHGGSIFIESDTNSGTNVTLTLPLNFNESCQQIALGQLLDFQGSESILIIDDEPDLLSAMQKSLSYSGYQLVKYSSLNQLISHIDDFIKRTDLLVTDLTMPHIDGMEIIKKVRSLAPNLPVIVISGRFTDPSEAGISPEMIQGFLRKPFSQKELLQSIRKVLDQEK
jgi:PAS domain S-box-containing protein